MHLDIPTQRSCATAWVAAASSVVSAGDEAYNVVIDVDDPVNHNDSDNQAISLVDDFLKSHDQNPIITVANTIFPQSLYNKYGSPEFFDVYHRDFDKFSVTKRWGRYFDRISRHSMLDGTTYNPLEQLIKKIQRHGSKKTRYRSAYELAVYDPLRDSRTLYGGQCLSFLSFKVHPERGLLLTAMYRNHTYITRCLGNLIGLGRLQAFVANQAQVQVGSLTCISTHAEIDVGDGWGIRDARKLVDQASKLVNVKSAEAIQSN
jgi:hypothetical protein